MLLMSGNMYVRATTRKNKNGSTVCYLQLAHNEWDAATGTSRPQVLHRHCQVGGGVPMR